MKTSKCNKTQECCTRKNNKSQVRIVRLCKKQRNKVYVYEKYLETLVNISCLLLAHLKTTI